MKFYTKAILLFSCFLMVSCEMIDYHPYDVSISGETHVNAKNIVKIEENCKGKKTIKFVVMGDSHRWYDETVEFVHSVNKIGDVDFVIHNGDISDFGSTDAFMWTRDIMNKLKMPYVAILGNHDCLGTGEEAFRVIFGDLNYSFIAGGIKFVCLNTNAIEYDYSRPIPNFDFLKGQIEERKDEFNKTIVSMHVPPYSNVFNNNVALFFEDYINAFPGLQFCTAGHNHRVYKEDLFDDGTMYYMSDCMGHRNYYIFTITPNGYDSEVVYF